MKKIIYSTFFAVLSSIIIIELVTAHKAGEAGKTGSPSEGTCASATCHTSNALNTGGGSVVITSDMTNWNYVPGNTYSVSVTVTKSGQSLFGLGFEALSSTNVNAGTLIAGTTTSLMTATNGRKNIVHKSGGLAGTGTYTFTFSWTAPSTNIGNVTFYCAANAANGTGTKLGDYIYSTSQVITPSNVVSIVTGTIAGSPFCEGQTGISIPFTANGTFNSGNVFTAQLSDATGSFTTPATIGTLAATASGTITSSVALPSVAGTAYRIRVVSSDTVATGSDNGSNLTIVLQPTTSAAGADQAVCGTSATMAANTATTGTGLWTVVNGTGTFANASSATTTVSGLSAGTNTFRWTISNGSCTPSADDIIITSTSVPTTASAGADQSVCATSATLAGNNPSAGTGTWTVISGTGTFSNVNNPTSTVSGLSAGSNTFRWTINNGLCTPSTDDVIVTSANDVTTANAGTDQSVCATSATLAANTPTSGTGEWSVISGTGSFSNAVSPTSTVNGLSTGINTFRWTISNGPCTPSSDDIIITVVSDPTTANAGTDQTVCGTVAPLAGNTAVTGTGVWTVVSGSGNFNDANSPTTFVSGLSNGNNTFRWTISNSPCPSSSDDVVITSVTTPSVSDAGADFSVCGTSTTLSANNPGSGTGIWSVISGSASIVNAGSPTSSVTGLSVGQNIFVWTISNSPCANSTDTVIVTGISNPTIADAGPDQTACVNFATLSANTPTAGIGTWSVVNGSGIFADVNNPITTVTAISSGVNTYKWTVSNPPCASSSDDVIITQSGTITVADAGADQVICSGSTTLAGNTASAGTGSWTLVSGTGIITTPDSATSGLTGLGVGDNIFRWTITNGSCSPTTDEVIITVTPQPTTANAGADQTSCTGSATLTGNTPAIGSGLWTLVSGAGTIVSPASPSTNVNGLGAGTNIFQWTISNSPCSSSSDSVTITKAGSITIADAGPDQSVCGGSAVLAGNTPGAGTGSWTAVNGTATFSDATNPTTAISDLSSGTNAFVWTISNGACTPSTDTVIITSAVNPAGANAGIDQSVCGTIATLAGNTAVIGNGVWSVSNGAGLFSNATDPSTDVTGLTTGTNSFIWTISNPPCAATADTVNIVSVTNPTSANAGIDTAVCGSITSLNGNQPSDGLGVWSLINGSGIFSDSSLSTTGISDLSNGSNTFVWTISNAPCAASADTIIITSVANPSVANAGADQTVCDSSATLSANVPAEGDGSWIVISGSGTFSNAASATASVINISIGTNIYRWTISNAPCTSVSDEVTITRKDKVTIADAGVDQTICSTFATISGNTPFVGSGSWSVVSGSATISSPDSATTNVTGISSSLVVLRWTIRNSPCDSSYDDVAISNCNNGSIITGTINGSPFCSGTGYSVTVSFTTTGTFNGYYTAELSDASGSFSTPVVIGSSSVSPIYATIPGNTPAGSGYRIRVSNNNPSLSGTDNGGDLSINNCPANSISTDPVSGSPFCINTSYSTTVSFTTTGTLTGSYNVELSNEDGIFTPATLLATTTTSPVTVNIPGTMPTGYGYRIRVVNPAMLVTGSDNGDDLSINSCFSISIDSVTGSPFCPVTGYELEVPFTYIGQMSGSFFVELSDSAGSFANGGRIIGFGPTSPINVTIPSGTITSNNYKLRIRNPDKNIFGDESNAIAINTCGGVGLNEKASNMQLSIYPNPNNGVFNIGYTLSKARDVNIVVTDVLGKTISDKSYLLKSINGKIECKLNNVQQGIYFVKVTGDDFNSVKIITIE